MLKKVRSILQYQDNRGISLIETLLGITILVVVGISLFTLISFTLKVIWESQAKIIGTQLANQKIEMAQNLAYEDVGTEGGIPTGPIPANEVVERNGLDYVVATEIQYVDDPFDGTLGGDPDDTLNTDYKKIRVEVSWPYRLTHQPIVFVTNIVPPGLESAVGGGTLKILAYSAYGQPVAQANVSIVNATVVPNININTLTDDQGYVILPGSPESTESYEITVSKNGYSTDKTYATTAELPSPEKPHASVFEGQTTNVSFAIDRLSSLNVSTISGSFSDWWNGGWTKRKQIITNNSNGELSNYQLQVVLDYESEMQEDFDDVRFADRYGMGLDYWRESYTASTTATFWVEATTVPSGQGYLYAYYGNATVDTTSDGSNTFLMFEDFEDYTLGSLDGQGLWEIYTGNPFTVTDDDAYSGSKSAKSDNHSSWMRTASQGYGGDIFIDYWVKMTNKGNDTTADYFFQTKSNKGKWDRIGHRGEYSINNWYAQVSYSEYDTGRPINLNNWQHAQIGYYDGNRTKMWIDGYEVINRTSQVKDLDYIMIGNDGYDRGYFDRIIVRRYTPPEPSTSMGVIEDRPAGAYLDLAYIDFDIEGSKIIGYDDLGLPVLKYSNSLTTDVNGQRGVTNLEWDTYTLSLPEASAYNIAETNPVQPYNLLPDTTSSISLTLEPKATHSVLVIVQDINEQPLEGASVHLDTTNPSYDETQITNDSGQIYFSPWIEATSTLDIILTGYQNYSDSFDASGYHIERITLVE